MNKVGQLLFSAFGGSAFPRTLAIRKVFWGLRIKKRINTCPPDKAQLANLSQTESRCELNFFYSDHIYRATKVGCYTTTDEVAAEWLGLHLVRLFVMATVVSVSVVMIITDCSMSDVIATYPSK